MPEHCLVTGGAGFIGSHLCERLLDAGHQVTVIDDLSSGSLENLDKARSKHERALKVIIGDARSLMDHLADVRHVTRIYHLAALISGHDSLHEPHDYIRVNVDGMLELIALASKLEQPHIVFASSSTVYGNRSDATIMHEELVPEPISVYALSKLTGEHLLSMYAGLKGFTHTSLRLFNVYGPRQAHDHPYANVTCKFSYAAAHGAGVKRYGDGDQSRDFIFVEDVVDAMLAAGPQAPRTLYNVGTGRDSSINQLLELLEDLGDGPIPVEQCPPWPNDIRAIRADASRLREDLDIKPRTKLEDGLRATVDWFRSRQR